MVLEYSVRGIFDFHCQEGIQIFKLNNLCVFKVKYMLYKKTKKHIKNLVHSLLFRTRFLKNDLLNSTESENIIPSLHAVTIMS